jgi:hypothetical protein
MARRGMDGRGLPVRLLAASALTALLVVPALLLAIPAWETAEPFGRGRPTGPADSPSPPVAPTFAIANLGGATEPSITAAPDGTLYVAAPSGLGNTNPASSYLWRSDDGLTWQYLPPVFGAAGVSLLTGIVRGLAPGGGDADVSVDAGGRLYYSDLTLVDASIASSADRGATWDVSTPVSGPPVDDRQWIVATSPGVVYSTAAEIGVGVWVWKSTDGGLTFLHSEMVTNFERGFVGAAPGGPLAVDPTDPAHVTLSLFNVGSGRVMVDETFDAGATWTLTTIADSVSNAVATNWPVLAFDAAGNAYATWTRSVNGTVDLYVAAQPKGEPWGAPVRVLTGGTTMFPWIAAGQEGHVALAYYHTSEARESPGSVSSAAYWDLATMVNLQTLTDPTAWGAPVVVDAQVHKGSHNRQLGDFFELTVDPQGREVISYNDDNGHGVRVMVATQTGGTLL